MRFKEAVALEKILRAQLGPVGQQRNAEEFFLFREFNGVLEQKGAVAVTAKGIVHNKILKQKDKPAFCGANREKEIDHPHDRPVAAKYKDAAAIRLLEDQAKPLELFLFVRAEILFLAEKFAKKIRQLIQIFKNRRFDNDLAHGMRTLFHKLRVVAMRDMYPSLLLMLLILLLIP